MKSVLDLLKGARTALVTVYSKPNCPPCNATKRFLTMNGVEHEVIDISEDPSALEYALSLGYKETPVVVTSDGQHWSGHRPTMLDKVLAA